MNRQDLQKIVINTLKSIAPEIEESELMPDQLLRDQVDLDSMDWLNFLIGLHERLKVDIPEADYAKLVTMEKLLNYLSGKIDGTGS